MRPAVTNRLSKEKTKPRFVISRTLIGATIDRKSTRLNSSHDQISYAVFCLKKKNQTYEPQSGPDLLCRPQTESLERARSAAMVLSPLGQASSRSPARLCSRLRSPDRPEGR